MKKIAFAFVANGASLFANAQKATPLWRDFIEAGVNESQGKMVMPASLFEAQLQLRLTGKDISARK